MLPTFLLEVLALYFHRLLFVCVGEIVNIICYINLISIKIQLTLTNKTGLQNLCYHIVCIPPVHLNELLWKYYSTFNVIFSQKRCSVMKEEIVKEYFQPLCCNRWLLSIFRAPGL